MTNVDDFRTIIPLCSVAYYGFVEDAFVVDWVVKTGRSKIDAWDIPPRIGGRADVYSVTLPAAFTAERLERLTGIGPGKTLGGPSSE